MKDRQIWYEVIFEQVKMRDVLTMYVSRVDKPKGRIPCPFHHGHDNNFSYNTETFHCWVCGIKGNVISFVAQLFGISNIDAAHKIDDDFNLGIFGKKPKLSTRRKAERRKKEQEHRIKKMQSLHDEYDWLCSIRRYYYYFIYFPKDEEQWNRAAALLEGIDDRLDELAEEIDGYKY